MVVPTAASYRYYPSALELGGRWTVNPRWFRCSVSFVCLPLKYGLRPCPSRDPKPSLA